MTKRSLSSCNVMLLLESRRGGERATSQRRPPGGGDRHELRSRREREYLGALHKVLEAETRSVHVQDMIRKLPEIEPRCKWRRLGRED